MKQVDHNKFWYIDKNPISRVGVFPYLGEQISAELEADKVYNVYRPSEELFSEAAMASFKLLPLVDDHEMLGEDYTPAEDKGVHGVIGEQIACDGDMLVADLKIFSERLKEEIQAGKKELSLGYFCDFEVQDGEYKGEHYDAVQRNIRGNHIALVERGRMGHEVRVMDKKCIQDVIDFVGHANGAPAKQGNGGGSAQALPVSDENDKHDAKTGQFAPKGSGTISKTNEERKPEQEQSTQEVTAQQIEEKIFTVPASEATRIKGEIQEAITNTNVSPRQLVDFGSLPKVYEYLGLPAGNIKTNKFVLLKGLGKADRGDHRVKKEDLMRLPELISNPVAVFKSNPKSTNPKAYVALLDAEGKNGDPVVAIIAPKGNKVLFIPSVHDRTDFGKFLQITALNNNIVYIGNKKTFTQFSVQFRTSVKVSTNNIPDKAAVVKHYFEKERNKEATDSIYLSGIEALLKEFNESFKEDLGGAENAPKGEKVMENSEVIEEIIAVSAKPASEFEGGEEEKKALIVQLAQKLSVQPEQTGEEAAVNAKAPAENEVSEKGEKEADEKPEAEAKKAAEEKAETKQQVKTGDEMNKLLKELAERNAFYKKLSPIVGAFDNDAMSINDMAVYALKKLNIKTVENPVSFMQGYAASHKAETVYTNKNEALAVDNMAIDTIDVVLKK